MAACVAFQTQLNSIMEMLAKAAVVEIGKLWEDGFSLLQAELRRKNGEIEALNRRLMSMESERIKAQSRKVSSASSQTEPKRRMLPLNGDGKNNHDNNNKQPRCVVTEKVVLHLYIKCM